MPTVLHLPAYQYNLSRGLQPAWPSLCSCLLNWTFILNRGRPQSNATKAKTAAGIKFKCCLLVQWVSVDFFLPFPLNAQHNKEVVHFSYMHIYPLQINLISRDCEWQRNRRRGGWMSEFYKFTMHEFIEGGMRWCTGNLTIRIVISSARRTPRGKKGNQSGNKAEDEQRCVTLKGILSIHPLEYGFIYKQLRMPMINDHSIDTTREGFSCKTITKWTNPIDSVII